MPVLAIVLVIGVTLVSHLLRGEAVSTHMNIGISAVALWLIVGLACTRFGLGVDFWADMFVAVVYSVCGTIELLELLMVLYAVCSPLSKDEEMLDKGEWVKMRTEPRG